MRVVGLMSGTSVDSIDAAVVDIPDDVRRLRVLAFVSVPFAPLLRERIFRAFRPETSSVDELCRLNFDLGEAFAAAALQAIAAAGFTTSDEAPSRLTSRNGGRDGASDVGLIGSHGQTVWHDVAPDGRVTSTLQLGEPCVIAERTGITTIADFRPRDVAAGGQGAPLVCLFDRLFFADEHKNRAVQNIGGIANVTALPAQFHVPRSKFHVGNVEPIAFDTGPGNMLIDEAARLATGGAQNQDVDGRLALAGQVHAGLLRELMAHPYLAQSPPKTTGRELFGRQFAAEVWRRGQALGLANADIVATVTAFTAESIAQAYRDFIPFPIHEVILGGGGSRNPALVAMLRERLAPARVLTTEDFGLNSEAKEAVAFAVLAYQTWQNRPGNVPSCTGARRPVVLGKIVPGRSTVTHDV
jgi:anhydro-N-acetylmuramic acid kinase